MNYSSIRALAAEKRALYEVETSKLNLTKMNAIYRAEGITVDRWKLKPTIRGSYMCDGGDPSVLINRGLPMEPRLFVMVHELKHHYLDREALESGKVQCGDYNANRDIEIAAEVFAAEFIFPEEEFRQHVKRLGLDSRQAEAADVVAFKRKVKAPVSFKFLVKRFEFLRLVAKGSLDKVHFKKLEEELYGVPIYKQDWFIRRRNQRSNSANR